MHSQSCHLRVAALLITCAALIIEVTSICTTDTSDLLTCNRSTIMSSALRPISGICLGCCPSQLNTTSSQECSPRSLKRNVTATPVSLCLSDGGQVTCPDVQTTTLTTVPRVSVVSGVCLRTASCLSPCNALTTIGRVVCSEVNVAVNTTRCAWSYANEPQVARCPSSVMFVVRGVCISSSSSVRSCQNYSTGVLCCPLLDVSSSSTASMLVVSKSLSANTVTKARLTSSQSGSRRSSPSVHMTNSNVTFSGRVTPSRTLAQTHTSSLSASLGTHTGRTALLTPSSSHGSVSHTRTLPSRSQRGLTPTFSIQNTVFPVAVVSPRFMDALAFGRSDATLVISLNGSGTRWRPETVPFIDQSMSGTQSWNPFGFDAQKEVLFAGVTLPPIMTNPFSVLQIRLRQDQCLDVRYDEDVFVVVSTDFMQPADGSATFRDGADTQVVVAFTIRESPTHATRRKIGLAVSIVVTILLIISGLLGNWGVSLLTFCEFQIVNVIGRQSCSRGVIAAYFEDAFWVVTPTLKAAAFSGNSSELGEDFGVVLVHTVFAVLFFTTVVIASRLRKRVRMLFPSLPLGVVYILFIGATNAAWRSVIIHPENPGTATGAMVLWVVFFLALGATVWRIRSPRGLLFLRYNRGLFSGVLRGIHSPLQLRGKYSLMIDLWHESFVEFASPIHLLHLSFSSIVCAFSSGSPLLCFPVLGTQLVWQSLVFLMTTFSQPGRSPFHNALLMLHSAMPLFLLAAATLSLDCLVSKNFYLAEWFTVITLCGYFISAVLQVWMSFVERRYRADVEAEFNDISTKHRRIVFVGLTEQQDKLPPISKHFVAPRLVDPDWRSKRHQDMFSFPLLRKVGTDGDVWSSPLTGMTVASASERLRNQQQQQAASASSVSGATLQHNGGGAQHDGWSRIAYGDNFSSDEDDTHQPAELSDVGLALPPAAIATAPGDPFGGSVRSAPASPSGWVSARFDALHAGNTALRPLASQLRINPTGAPTTGAAAYDHHQNTLGGAIAEQPSRDPPLPGEHSNTRRAHRVEYDQTNPRNGATTYYQTPPQQRADRGGAHSSGERNGGETVSRCPTCSRWIILEEGCDVCALAS